MSDYESDAEPESSFSIESPVAKKTKAPAAAALKKPKAAPKKKAVIDKENSEADADEAEPATKPKGAAAPRAIEDVYQKLTQLQHVLLRPDTYIGSVKVEEQTLWVWNADTKAMEQRTISFPPGLYKIFDEILVNAADNFQRSEGTMKAIKVTIDPVTCTISVWNDGKGIPIELHKAENVQVPELIFGELLTGSNFHGSPSWALGRCIAPP